jgi:hypothetical protein
MTWSPTHSYSYITLTRLIVTLSIEANMELEYTKDIPSYDNIDRKVVVREIRTGYTKAGR